MIVFTACNEAYIPGAIALHNSFRAYNDGRFVVLFDGDDPSPLTRLGIEVIKRPRVDLPVIPVTDNRPEETAEVHCYRFAIPELTDGDRAIYIDADALVVKDLTPIWELEFGQPIAATVSNAPLRKEIVCTNSDMWAIARLKSVPEGRGFISSFMVFNIPEWKRQGVLEKCQSILKKGNFHFCTGDQALLNWALLNNWFRMSSHSQIHVGQPESQAVPKDRIFVKHFLGTNPWDEIPKHLQPYPMYKLRAREEWRRYYDKDANSLVHEHERPRAAVRSGHAATHEGVKSDIMPTKGMFINDVSLKMEGCS